MDKEVRLSADLDKDDRMFLANVRAVFRKGQWDWFLPERIERLLNLASAGVALAEVKEQSIRAWQLDPK